jgi:hypothetical protein
MGYRCYISMKHQFQNMKDQFNGKTNKRRLPPHLTSHKVYEMVKNVHVVLGKQKMTHMNIKEDDIWQKQLIFGKLPYWIDLDARYSIDVMYVKKKMCESFFRTLLNIDEKTRDHGHAQADPKKIEIRPELWLDDSVRGMELTM